MLDSEKHSKRSMLETAWFECTGVIGLFMKPVAGHNVAQVLFSCPAVPKQMKCMTFLINAQESPFVVSSHQL